MCSRDCCTFITNHCSEDKEKLSGRIQVGQGHSECKLIKYERMRTMVEAKRLSSQLSQQKVQKVLDTAQVNKERSVLRLHRQVWLQEHHRLNIARHKTEKDFQHFLHGIGLEEAADMDSLSQLQEYELELEKEREKFRLTTVEPVYHLRDDLQYRLTAHCSTANDINELEEVLQQVLFVRQQQKEVMDRLQCECATLQHNICVADLKEHLLSAAMGDQVAYLEKVPEEILIADCPYPDLRSDLIHSFHSLTEKYKLRLSIVESRLQGLNRNCGWNAADHECFQHIMSQYSPSLRNQRSLYIDMLQRLLPHITQQEMLQQWRIQQEQAAELEATLAAYWHKEEEERLRKEQQREKTRRAQLTQQINRFHAEKQKRREEQRKRDMKRLAELRREIEQQMQRDKERVKFRKELLQQKLQMCETKEKQKQKDDKEREERLQALCNQVSKVAEANPERMMGNTVAWRVRQLPEEVFALQRPLYQLNTYTDKQIVSDPRVRIEQALRTAGLHNSPYARQILNEIQPPKPHRRDMESTAFRT
ncbi:coiled-coil domain-containing protein 148-like isoform X3 [Ctenopharyngodon idella]|uniref:coiled-coil domain-containing protein 148-like isoform X3 n=1 Tax=Ctenopharyngodon idella TaxID=7959 RepID=UPI002231F187|nr:coiled-coil domain-containing protein 148-like isoform X3 [Ctenopharyngodon idella]